jgi:hypothetical protein
MWLQNNDDIKLKIQKKRNSLYDKIKIPLFVAILIIVLKDIDYNKCIDNIKIYLTYKQSIPEIIQLSTLKNNNNNNAFDIFTELPDF